MKQGGGGGDDGGDGNDIGGHIIKTSFFLKKILKSTSKLVNNSRI